MSTSQKTMFIEAAIIPNKIAEFLVQIPETPPLLVNLHKKISQGEPDHYRLEDLTDDDVQILRSIWADLPIPDAWNMTPEQFALCRKAFDVAPNKPEWQIQAEFRDYRNEAKGERAQIAIKHMRQMENAVHRGSLHILTAHRVPGDKLEPGTLISIADARAYLEPLGLDTSWLDEIEGKGSKGDDTFKNSEEKVPPKVMEWLKAMKEQQDAAGGFENSVIVSEAARKATEARGYPVLPENFSVTRYETEAERLAEIAKDERHAATPEGWAYYMSRELAERNGGKDDAQRCAAETQIMRTFEAYANTLPLRQAPTLLLWPKGQPLPPRWRDGLFLRKDELRVWAKEYCPDFLGSALLDEPVATTDAKKVVKNGINQEWQNKIENMAAEYNRDGKKSLATKGTLAKKLGKEIKVDPATIERQTRKTW